MGQTVNNVEFNQKASEFLFEKTNRNIYSIKKQSNT
ncbi:unnamed protein product [Arabidopsis halleri]